MADNLHSFAELIRSIARNGASLRYDKPTKRPHGHRKARNRRLNAVAREQRRLERRSKKNRDLRTPPRERRA